MKIRAKDLLLVFLICGLSTVILWIFSGLSIVNRNFDGPYYSVVARCGYEKSCIESLFSFPLPSEYYAAHFPLFPILIRAVSFLTQTNLLTAGVISTFGVSILYGVVLYVVYLKLGIKHALSLALIGLFFWPRMWAVRSISSPEPLFLLFIVLSLFSFEKKKFFWSGIFGALATFTKSPGILLFVSYGLYALFNLFNTKKINWKYVFLCFIPLGLLGVFGIYYFQTGDFLAYFHSGDNIHLQLLPFKVFDSSQSWVGTFWLEDILWIYLIGAIGIWQTFRMHKVWGWFGLVFYGSILFVSHRDISRYALPLVPVVLLGLEDFLARKEVKLILLFLTIPLFLYTLNFVRNNALDISNFTPFLPFSR